MPPQLWTARSIFALLLPFVLGLGSWLLWHYELELRAGWAGLAWLDIEHYYSIWWGLFACSFCFVFTSWSIRNTPLWLGGIALCLLFLLSLLGFYLAKSIFYALFQPDFFSRPDSESYRIKLASGLLLLVSGTGSAFFFIKQRLLFRSNPLHILTFIFVLFTLVPASLGSVELLLNWSNGERFVDAVKMGYPLFWSPILLGTTVWMMGHKLI